MADNTINVRIKEKIDTESNWTSKNPILLKGERGLIEGTAKYKIGDGSTRWSDLPLYQGMTSTDRSKLDGIASGANKTVVDSTMSSTSTNPVQNKVVKSALDSQNTELKKLINTKLSADFDTVNQNVSFNGSVHAEDLTAGNIIVTGAARFNSGMYGDVHGNATSADSVDWSGIKNKPSTYTPSSHNHDDRYYTEAETDKKLDTKSNTGHTHDDRYYTESEIDTKLNGKSDTSHTHNLSTMINTLSEGTATPQDNDYYVSQYVGGTTTITTYHRRPLKALFEYIKGKLSTVAVSGSYNDLSNKPTIPSVGNGTVTIKQAGTSKGTFTMNQSGNTTIELTDNNTNTWRGIQDNLTSTSTTDSLSANQGKWLNENKTGFKEWTASVKCATWSRLCYVACKSGVIGSSFILNISGTRNTVVYNDTFGIKIHHSKAALVSKLSGSKYGSSIQLRVVSDSSGNGYIEIYDKANGATNTTTQSVICSLVNIAAGSITTYTSFTDGSTIPTNFVQSASITTNSNSLQGNLTWDEITGKPSFKTVATSGSYNDLSNKPTIGDAKITVTQGGTQKGTFTLNQTGDVSIALTDTNTWRGVQNNLTSTATDQSLSANQGKILNEKFASYVPTSRTVNGKALTGNITLSASDVGASASGHTHDNSTITSLDASKITTGTIDIARLPQGALERCVIVADDTARFKLTTDSIQTGDTVKVTGTGKMYFVIDDTKLTSEDGYTVYTAGSATSVPWSGITGKPSTFTPSTHTHSSVNDSNDGQATTFAYSKAGMGYSGYTWLAGWNGKELRAINKNQFATASHNHDTTYLKLSGGTVTGETSFTKGTESTSTTTGTVKVTGGVGVSGRVSANEINIGNGCTLKYNSTNKCLDFVFN